jgi:hypothetical protein
MLLGVVMVAPVLKVQVNCVQVVVTALAAVMSGVVVQPTSVPETSW